MDDADAWGSKHFADWGRGLSAEERSAVHAYTGGGYESINGALRAGTAPAGTRGKTPQVIAGLDAALARGSAPEPLTAYRGVRGPFAARLVELARTGGTLTDPGYLSATLAPGVVDQGFARHPDSVVVSIRVPAGAAGAYTDVEADTGEAEWLMPRGTTLRLSDPVKGDDGRWRLTAEVVPQSAARPAATFADSQSRTSTAGGGRFAWGDDQGLVLVPDGGSAARFDDPPPLSATPGESGDQLDDFAERAVEAGIGRLAELVRAGDLSGRGDVLGEAGRAELADELAGVLAVADLLGRVRVLRLADAANDQEDDGYAS